MDNVSDLPEHWSEDAKSAFSRMFRHTSCHQELFTHPEMELLPQHQWDTICWNMSWIAAGCAVKSDPFLHVDDEGNVLAAEVTKEEMQ